MKFNKKCKFVIIMLDLALWWDTTFVLLGQRNPPGVIFRPKTVLKMKNKGFGEI